MKKIFKLLSLIVVFCYVFSFSVHANTNNKAKIYIDKSLLMEGVYNEYSINFNIYENMKFKDGKFSLDFSVSKVMDYKYSAMIVYLNGSPIGTYELYPLKGKSTVLEIPLKKENIQEGFNQITIKAFHKISDGACLLDEANIANWISIKDTSFVEFSYEMISADLQLTDLPLYYTNEYNKEDFELVIGKEVDKDESNAAVNIVRSLQKLGKSKVNNYKVKTISDFTKKNDSIVVMKYDNLPKEIKNALGDVKDINTKALVQFIKSPYNSNKVMLVITSNDTSKLIYGARVIGNKKYLNNVQSKLLIENYEEEINNDENKKITLNDMGYGNSTQYGRGELKYNYFYTIPDELEFLGGNLKLRLSYSPNIDNENSKVVVKINDILIGEYLLEKNNYNNYELNIPLDKLPLQDIKRLDIRVSMILSGEDKCIESSDKLLQGTIYNNSEIEIVTKNRKVFNIDNYRGIFATGKVSEIVVPRSIEYLEIASDIIKQIDGQFNLLFSDNVQSIERNGIIIGTPEDNKLVNLLNTNSNIKFNSNNENYSTYEPLSIVEGSNKDISTIEIMDSPWNKKNKLVVFKSTAKENLIRDSKYLSQYEYSDILTGSEATVNGSRTNTTEAVVQKVSKLEYFKSYFTGERRVILELCIFTILTISGMSLFYLIRKRRKK